MSFPSILAHADFAMVRLTLEFVETCRLDPFVFLRLRSRLLRSGRELFGDRAIQWFDPPLSSDPQALRRFQKPAPAFVIRSQLLRRVEWDEGDTLDLEILFLGDGLQQLSDFISLVQHFGRCGVYGGSGCFDLAAIHCLDASGTWRQMTPARRGGEESPHVLSVGWWLDSHLPLPESFRLAVTTPARLMVSGHSLRRPQFRQLFPFMLRRVTSMLYYHCKMEPMDDFVPLLAVARQIETEWEQARWIDWHDQGDESEWPRLGGLTGSLRLSGQGRGDLDWIIALSTLFGVGRGAAFGAGRLDLLTGQGQEIL